MKAGPAIQVRLLRPGDRVALLLLGNVKRAGVVRSPSSKGGRIRVRVRVGRDRTTVVIPVDLIRCAQIL